MALWWLWVALPGLASRGFSHLALSVAPSSGICLPLPGCSIENSGIPGEIPCVHSQTRRMVDLPVRRLGLHCVLPAPTVSCRWLPGAAPAHLPCGSSNLLRLWHLRASSCTLSSTMKVCDLLVLPLTVLPAVASRAGLHPSATPESLFPVSDQAAYGLSPSRRSWRRRGS